MFDNCSSLYSIDLSNINTTFVKNAESMFANDMELVYINFSNIDESNIKVHSNMLAGTRENMVFCINKSQSNFIYNLIKRKSCTTFDCSTDWIKSRKKIVVKTNKCVDECPEGYKFDYHYNCMVRCPKDTLPDEFICKLDYEIIANKDNCSIRDYFRNKCNISLSNAKLKQQFIEKVATSLIKGELYDLTIVAIDNKMVFTRREDDIVFQLYSLSNKYRENDLVFMDLEECGKLLRKKYRLDDEDDIIVFKIEYYYPYFKIPIVEYNLYGQFGLKKLGLNYFNKLKINYLIPKTIEDYEDYKYNPGHNFYKDGCITYTINNKSDIIINDRKNEFNKNNMSLCESMCEFKGYVQDSIKCECDIKLKFNSFLNTNVSKYNLIYRFKIKEDYSSNFWVFKCILLIFTKEIITSNICSQIILGIIGFSFIGAFIFWLKGYDSLYNKIKNAIEITLERENKTNKEPPKKNKEIRIDKNKNVNNNKNKKKNHNQNRLLIHGKNNANIGMNKQQQSTKRPFFNSTRWNNRNQNQAQRIRNIFESKIKNAKKNKNKIENKETTDNELNDLPYEDALIEDKRTFLQTYFSLIRSKELFLFTFSCKNDYNSRIIKLNFFLLIFGIMFFLNTAFVDEKTLHNIYLIEGKTDIMFSITILVIITIISFVIKNLLFEIIFTEDDILPIKSCDKAQRKIIIRRACLAMTLRSYLFYVFSIVFLSFFWFYIICFI